MQSPIASWTIGKMPRNACWIRGSTRGSTSRPIFRNRCRYISVRSPVTSPMTATEREPQKNEAANSVCYTTSFNPFFPLPPRLIPNTKTKSLPHYSNAFLPHCPSGSAIFCSAVIFSYTRSRISPSKIKRPHNTLSKFWLASEQS